MVLALHILIALASVAFATYTFFTPSKAKIGASYSMVAATIASGTYLVVATDASMLHACMSGLFFTVTVSAITYASQRKLAAQIVRIK